MERLYWKPWESGEQPDVEALQDADRVLEMVRAVGDAACREVADFLEAGAARIEGHFRSLPDMEVKKRTKRSRVEERWEVQLFLSMTSLPGRRVRAALYIHDRRALVVPWLR